MKTYITSILFAACALAAAPFGHAAEITGQWRAEFDTQIGVQKYIFTLKVDGDKLSGKAASDIGGEKREVELKEGQVKCDKDGLMNISHNFRAYLKEKNVPHLCHVDSGGAHLAGLEERSLSVRTAAVSLITVTRLRRDLACSDSPSFKCSFVPARSRRTCGMPRS